MTGSAMSVIQKTGRIRTWANALAHALACASVLAILALGVVRVSQTAAAADVPAGSAPEATASSVTGTVVVAAASSAPSAADTRSLDEDTQSLKKDVVDLNRDLFVLEEELLFPANTQVAVYVSMDVGEFFGLDSISLKIDNKEVTNYLYTPREVDALLKGGVQRLYLGNLKVGNHEW